METPAPIVDHVHLTKKGNAAVARALFEGIRKSEETDRLVLRFPR